MKQMYKVLTVSDIYHMSLLTVHVGYVIEVNESRGGGKGIQTFQLVTCTAFTTSVEIEIHVKRKKLTYGHRELSVIENYTVLCDSMCLGRYIPTF
jgi:hypothetical protein